MRSNHKSITTTYHLNHNNIDFIDLNFVDDLKLYVDPILFWRSTHSQHHMVHAQLVEFFERAIDFVQSGRIELAKKMCIFPEPENLLGDSKKGHQGHGSGKELGQSIFEEIVNNPEIWEAGLSYLNEFPLMIKGVSDDLVSDMTVNIAKQYFVWYTQKQCEYHKIPLTNASTRVYLWDENRWGNAHVLLPVNPETKESYILTPQIVVKRAISFGYKDFYKDHLRHIFKKELQDQWFALGKSKKVQWKDVNEVYPMTKDLVVTVLHENPDLKKEYLSSIQPEREQLAAELTFKKLSINDVKAHSAVEAIKDLLGNTSNDFVRAELSKVETRLKENSTKSLFDTLPQYNEILERMRESVVLLLGSYDKSEQDIWDVVNNAICEAEYETCIVKNMPDIGHPNLRTKLFMYAASSRFVVVLDFRPSGHLVEIELIKDLGVPIAIISNDQKGSTFMLTGIDQTHSFIKRFPLSSADGLPSLINEIIKWAESLLQIDYQKNTSNLPWRGMTGSCGLSK